MLEPDVEPIRRRFEDASRRYCNVIDSVEGMASSESLYIEIAALVSAQLGTARARCDESDQLAISVLVRV
jgi:hypothetical protein